MHNFKQETGRNDRLALHWANLILACLAALAPLAHVIELPNKLALGGPLWLAVQQHLYRGWGPFLGAPAEIGALTVTLILLFVRRKEGKTARLMFLAAAAYAAMIATFFLFNNPVNESLNGWTPATLPPNWTNYRLRWETGHALAALLAVVALVAVARSWLMEVKSKRPAG